MVIALLCLMVANARLMLAEFLVWFALSPFSSAPHLDRHQFSVHGASLTGPFNACAIAEPANAASTTPATIEIFMTYSFPEIIPNRPVVFESTAPTLLTVVRLRLVIAA